MNLICTMDKIDGDGKNKTQRLHRCCSNYALYRPSILIFGKGPIVADELGGIWVLPSPQIPSLLIQKIAKKLKINHIMVSFTNHYNAISIDKPPSKTKVGKYS